MADGTCKRLTQDDMDESIATYLDQATPANGISLTFLGEDMCNATDTFTLTVEIKCDQEVKSPNLRIKSASVANNLCHPTVYLDSPAGKIPSSSYVPRLHQLVFQQALEVLPGPHGRAGHLLDRPRCLSDLFRLKVR